MAISLAIFIYYMIWQNIASNRMLLERLRALKEAGNEPLRYLQLKQEYDASVKDWHRRTFRSWNWALILTVAPAAIATLLLFYGFLAFIFSEIHWTEYLRWTRETLRLWRQPGGTAHYMGLFAYIDLL
jgi:hypothetical protein